MIFVCNAGPVIALAKVDHLFLIRELSQSAWIPETVFYEVLAKPGLESSRILHATSDFLHVRKPPEVLKTSVQIVSRNLDAGERDVLALADAAPHPVTAILDDAAGRSAASKLGIPLLGFAGLLLVAKQRNLLPTVLPLLHQARAQGYWLSDELLETAKNLAQE